MKLSLRDKFQIVTTGLFMVLGLAILIRCASRNVPIAGYVVGVVFLGYGAYRTRYILGALRGRGASR